MIDSTGADRSRNLVACALSSRASGIAALLALVCGLVLGACQRPASHDGVSQEPDKIHAFGGVISSGLPLVLATTATLTVSTHIAAWGDSLTHSGYTTAPTSYPTQLAKLSGYSIFNGGVGGESSTQIRTRMIADTTKYSWPVIIWAGRNNFASATTVKADIAAMVAALGHGNYIILSVLNSDTALEWSGGASYTQIVTLNSDLATLYGAHYIDMRAYLVSLYNPALPQDVTDHGHDIPPTSLRADTLHLNAAGYLAVATRLNASISLLKTTSASVARQTDLPFIFANPPTLGATTPTEIWGTYVNVLNELRITQDLNSQTSHGPYLSASAASRTVPTLIPDNTRLDTGIGAITPGALSFIVKNNTEAMRLDTHNHMHVITALPTVTACGTSPVKHGTDQQSVITPGAGATGCVITFQQNWINSASVATAPGCNVTARNGSSITYSISDTAVTLSTGTTPGVVYDIGCTGIDL